MDDQERAELRNLLVAYFGDSPRDRGIRELLAVTRHDQGRHQRFQGTLTAGVRAARAGDPDVVPVVRQLSPFITDIVAAEALLTGILTDYERAYSEATQSSIPQEPGS